MTTDTLNLTFDKPEVRDAFSSLGIAVDNLSMAETVEKIVSLISAHKHDKKARLVATLNVDFMVNALGYFFSDASHPELLEILREADLVTADGFPVVLLSRLMGTPIKERVTGADLVPALAERAAEEGLSIYFLGGMDGSAEEAAERLQIQNPDLKVAGIAAPFVHVQGEALGHFDRDDESQVNAINSSGADILLIGFGNPKQEQWFHRNKDRLTVPVSIGVGGTFEFIAGRVKRAPVIVQRLNLEWLYRIGQDPARLWKRYVKGLFKFGLLTLPIVFIRLRELLTRPRSKLAQPTAWQLLWGSRQDVIQTLQLPRFVTRDHLQNLLIDLDTQDRQQRLTIIDCSRVKHIELAAYHAFFQLGQLFRSGTSGMLMDISPAVTRRLKAGRIMDACQRHTVQFNELKVPDHLPTDSMNCRSYVLGDAALIYLSGRIDGNALNSIGFDICVADMSRDRLCVIDLRHADLVESTAAGHFYRLLQSLSPDAHQILFTGISSQTNTMFDLSGFNGKLPMINDKALSRFIFSANKEPKT